MSGDEESWNIKKVDLIKRLGLFKEKVIRPPSELDYSILNTQHVAFREVDELAELHALTGEPPKFLVAFKPERLLWHEVIVGVVTSLRVKYEGLLYEDVIEPNGTITINYSNTPTFIQALSAIYEKTLDTPNTDKLIKVLKQRHEKIELDIQRYIKSGFRICPPYLEKEGSKIKEYFYIKRQAVRDGKLTLGTHRKGYQLHDAVAARFTDQLFSSIAAEKIQTIVADIIHESKFEKIEIPKPEDRVTYMLAGGPASGKGSSCARIMYAVESHNLKFTDLVRVNTDEYKPLLLEAGAIPGTTTYAPPDSSWQHELKDTNKEIVIYKNEKGIERQVTGEQWQQIIMQAKDEGKKTPVPITKITKEKWKESAEKAKQNYSQLAQEEASLISIKISERLLSLADEGKAPNTLVDQVFIGGDKLEYATKRGGKASVIFVSTDVNTALSRSYKRGSEVGLKGRYEHTEGLLRLHKLPVMQIPERCIDVAGMDVYIIIVDNNVPIGEQPADVLQIDCKQKIATIFDDQKLYSLVKKTLINPRATSDKELYEDAVDEDASLTKMNADYLKPLLNAGFEVIKHDAELRASEGVGPSPS